MTGGQVLWHLPAFPFLGSSCTLAASTGAVDWAPGSTYLATKTLTCYTAVKVVMPMRRSTVLLLLVLLLSIAGCSSGPTVSHEGNVKVTLPVRQATVTFVKQTDGSWKGSIRTTGTARAFEATVSWAATQQLSSNVLSSLGQGSFMTSAGAPEFGTFDQTLMLVGAASGPAPDGKGSLRIFITSMKDGSQQDIVDIPLVLALAPWEGRRLLSEFGPRLR